ncbi:MAG: hypothetical protein OHK0022_20350 [Roseiflexaceae bacterium]
MSNAEKTLVPSPKNLAELRVFTMPEGGLDRLSFVTWDVIEVLGHGEDAIEFQGYYAIERQNPTSADWREASVDIAMRELAVSGVSEKFGRIKVSTNDAQKGSGGQVLAGTTYEGRADSPKLCVMQGYMKFDLLDIGLSVFNKEPIVLRHNITHIPPVGQGGGTGPVSVDLYNAADPDGAPVAILRQVKTHIGAWLTEASVSETVAQAQAETRA